MEGLGVKIPETEKSKLFELAELHYPNKKSLHSAIGIDHSTYYDHKKGELDVIGLQKAASLISIVNSSQPVFDNPNEFLKRHTQETSDKYLDINDSVQQLVLNHFKTRQLEAIFDRSTRSVESYRTASSNVLPEQGFLDALDQMYRELDSSIDFKAEIFKTADLGNSSSEPLITVDTDKILEMAPRYIELERILDESLFTRGQLSSLDNLDTLFEKPYPEPESLPQSVAYGILDRADYLDKWGGESSSVYERKVGDDELYAVSNYLSNKEEPNKSKLRTYNLEDLIEAVQDFHKEEDQVPGMKDLNKGDYPGEGAISSKPQTFNDILFRAGLKPNRETYDEDILVDILAREYVKNDFEIPTSEQIDGSGYYPHMRSIERALGGRQSAFEKADIPLYDSGSNW